jgi:hypothetical protein
MRLRADAHFFWDRTHQVVAKYATTPRVELPSDVEPTHASVRVLRGVRAPMRDGVRLAADVYLPAGSGGALDARFPTVLIRMPYGKREAYCYMPAHGKYWARRGFACVIQDVRGRWASEGRFEPFVNEAADGHDTISWVADQPWCDGNVGMTGESYYGYTQWAAAIDSHPALKCVAPGDTAADIYGSWVYNGNAFCLQTMGEWSYGMNGRRDRNPYRFDPWHLPLHEVSAVTGTPSPTYEEWIEHPAREAYWDAVNVCQSYEHIAIPMMHWGGWYDVFLNGTIGGWQGMKGQAREDAFRDTQSLVIGPTDHELSPDFTGKIGRVELNGHGYTHDRVLRFMTRWLRGDESADEARVRLFVVGRNEWIEGNDWPPVGVTRQEYFLHGDGTAGEAGGTLSPAAPDDQLPDSYTYDPADPVTYWLGVNIWECGRHLGDRREVERRADVLTYTSEPLAAPLEAVGPLSVTLYAATTATDTDFTATLVDVSPDGYAHHVQEGIVRARYRGGDAVECPVTPGEVEEYFIDMWALGYEFAAGHRLRLEISSSNFDRYDRNPNTGARFGEGNDLRRADQTVHHSSRYPSRLSLPLRRRT